MPGQISSLRKTTLMLLMGSAIAFAPSVSNAKLLGFPGQNGTPSSFADLIDSVIPAVVAIRVRADASTPSFDGLPEEMQEFLEEFQGAPGSSPQTEGEGSGFFISGTGEIVTNYHVIEGATEIEVTLDSGDTYLAEVVGTDPDTDLAVIKVIDPDRTFDYVDFRSKAPLRRGDWVVAIGNPFGFEFTATSGIISNAERYVEGETYVDFIQIDAPINRGNSGGPLFDLEGRVVGINSSIYSPSGGNVGIAFAIPHHYAEKIVEQLRTDGRVRRGWLGVNIRTADVDILKASGIEENEGGAFIEEVVPGSPAASAGFESADIIVGIDGTPVETSTEVTRIVGGFLAGQRVVFNVNRGGEYRKINVTIAQRPDADRLNSITSGETYIPETSETPKTTESESTGLTISSISPRMRQSLGLEDDEDGVLVDKVEAGSNAERKGFRRGMVILEVGGEPVRTPSEFERAVQDAKDRGMEAVLLRVLTRVGKRHVGLPL